MAEVKQRRLILSFFFFLLCVFGFAKGVDMVCMALGGLAWLVVENMPYIFGMRVALVR